MAKTAKTRSRALGRLTGWLLGVVIVGGLGVRLIAPAQIEKGLNRVCLPPPYSVPPKASELHAELLVADMHADTLLWGRDPLLALEREFPWSDEDP